MFRIFRILLEDYRSALQQLSWEVFGTDSVDYYKTKVVAHWSDSTRRRAYSDSLVRVTRLPAERKRSELASYPGRVVLHANFMAGLARSDNKLRRELNSKAYLTVRMPAGHPVMSESRKFVCWRETSNAR
jgi:hypothetical protein